MIDRLFRKSGKDRHHNAAIPDGKRIYAIGDIHGRADMLDDLLAQIDEDIGDHEQAQLIFLGDYIDRGLDSRGVIDRLLAVREERPDSVFLKGNHEAIMLEFLADPEDLPHWLDWGGEETLESYGVDPVGRSPEQLADDMQAALPKAHWRFLTKLSLTHIEGDYLFVHAGVRPGAALEDQTETDLLWIRKRFHNAGPDERPDYVVVYGHTPVDKPEDAGWRIAIDTGACYGGMLTALVLEGSTRRFISVKD